MRGHITQQYGSIVPPDRHDPDFSPEVKLLKAKKISAVQAKKKVDELR